VRSANHQSPITNHLSLLAFLLANEGGSSLLEKLGPDVALSFGTSGTAVSQTFNEELIQRFSATSQQSPAFTPISRRSNRGASFGLFRSGRISFGARARESDTNSFAGTAKA
jgi:hypothetical protein